MTGLLLNVLSWPCTDSARSVCYIKDLFKGTWSLAEIFFQTKLLSRVSPRFCRFLSSHFRAKTIATLHFQPECFPLHSNASGRTSVFWLPWAMLKIFHWTSRLKSCRPPGFLAESPVFQTCFCIFKTGNSLTLQSSAKKLLHFVWTQVQFSPTDAYERSSK